MDILIASSYKESFWGLYIPIRNKICEKTNANYSVKLFSFTSFDIKNKFVYFSSNFEAKS